MRTLKTRTMMVVVGMTLVGAAALNGRAAAAEREAQGRLYLDEHDLGPGKASAEAVAAAHQRDLAVQGKHGVRYRAYWLDEKNGRIYCLVEAPTAADVLAAHKEAHGLLPGRIEEVREGR